MSKERNLYLDIVKGICILLVIVGHCIQYGAGNTYLQSCAFFENPIFIFIYSFHMPLFMLISGYLFAYSVSRKKWNLLLLTKFKQLIIPLGVWSIVSLLIEIFKIIIQGTHASITLFWIIEKLIFGFICGPWFLWAIWWSCLGIILVRTFMKDNIFIYILIILLSFVVPDLFNLGLYKFMWPFFLLAYKFNADGYNRKIKSIYQNKYFALSIFCIFFILLMFFDYDSYIYTSGFTVLNKNVLNQILINLYRFFIGMTGSISIMYLIYFLERTLPRKINEFLVYIGRNTLGIYIISGLLFTEVLTKITYNLSGLNYIYIVFESVLILILSIIMTSILTKFKITNVLFLGGR